MIWTRHSQVLHGLGSGVKAQLECLLVLAIFAVFALHGSWPIPDVNEPYYLGKAIHFWNPQWCPRDDFFATQDAHLVCNLVVGWLSLLFSPDGFALVTRLLTWGLLAISFRQLARALGMGTGTTVLAAILFVTIQERCAMAGEWVVGGGEAKGFAYALVFWGLALMVRGQWQRTWIVLGLATAMHVLVGGWTAIVAFAVWRAEGPSRPRLRTMLPGLLAAAVLALLGLLPGLGLSWGVPREILREANRIYTFERLAHHLVPGCFPLESVASFLLLTLVLAEIAWGFSWDTSWRRLRRFALGSLMIAAIGWLIGFTVTVWPDFAAAALRFYWFRLADVAVPLVASFFVVALAARLARESRILFTFAQPGDTDVGENWTFWCLYNVRRSIKPLVVAVASVFAVCAVGYDALPRLSEHIPRSEWSLSMQSVWDEDVQVRKEYQDWKQVCHWVKEHTPPDARFLTPRMKTTFKWYTGRSELVTWKDIPQDARSVVAWWEKLKDLYVVHDPRFGSWWVRNVNALGERRVLSLAAKYQIDYILTVSDRPLQLEVVFSRPGNVFVVYRPVRAANADRPNRSGKSPQDAAIAPPPQASKRSNP